MDSAALGKAAGRGLSKLELESPGQPLPRARYLVEYSESVALQEGHISLIETSNISYAIL
jgi:hypothetical protein